MTLLRERDEVMYEIKMGVILQRTNLLYIIQS